MSESAVTTLYYVHDPMCSWCWGFNETLKELIEMLPNNLKLVKLLGGLAKDSDEAMPEQMQQYLQNTWHKIEQQIPGVSFNYDFWKLNHPRRSTYPACRAVLAAGLQQENKKDAMILAIQQAYYQQAKNPSNISVLLGLAHEIGLDYQHFEKDLISDRVNQMLLKEIARVRSMDVISFPSLVLDFAGNQTRIEVDYQNVQKMLDKIRLIIKKL